MRIGIDCRLWSETGVGRYIGNLVQELQILDKKNNYVLFALPKDCNEIKIKNSKFKIVRTDIKWHTLDEQIRFPQVLNQENLDLMHFPYFSVPIFYSRPFVVTIHDLIVNHFPTGHASTLPNSVYGLKLLAYKFVLAQAARKAKKIIAVSNATKEEVIDHLGVNVQRVVVTYEGVSEEILNSKSQISNKSQNTKSEILNTRYFLYVGNAYPHKNLDRLLEAFSSLDSDISLILVGKEDYFYKRLKENVRKMESIKNVSFFQDIGDKELSGLYQNAKALILPSLMEGFGLPALEAMANNCLVLASDIPSLKEVCGDAAIYFDPYNASNIMEKMKEVYSNDAYYYSDKKKKGLERVKNFSWKKTAEKTLKVYESCISL